MLGGRTPTRGRPPDERPAHSCSRWSSTRRCACTRRRGSAPRMSDRAVRVRGPHACPPACYIIYSSWVIAPPPARVPRSRGVPSRSGSRPRRRPAAGSQGRVHPVRGRVSGSASAMRFGQLVDQGDRGRDRAAELPAVSFEPGYELKVGKLPTIGPRGRRAADPAPPRSRSGAGSARTRSPPDEPQTARPGSGLRTTCPSRWSSRISRSRSLLSCVRTRAIASASPVTLHASSTSGCARSVSATASSWVPGREEQLDQRLGVIAEGRCGRARQ